MTAIRSLLFQADPKEGFVRAIGSNIGALVQALALSEPLLISIALVEANIVEDALILTAIKRPEDGLATFQILAIKNGQ